MNVLTHYIDAIEALYEHVGFTEDWVIYPIQDNSHCLWRCDGKVVKYADTLEQFNSDGDYYEDVVYTQRFYKKWIYEGAEFTMIFCDPGVDGMKWFRVFANKNKVA